MFVSMKSHLRNLVLICCCCMLLCNGMRDAQAQYFSAASSNILSSNVSYDSAILYTLYGLYYGDSSYFYIAHIAMYDAYYKAYYGYYYGLNGYIIYGATINYYCQLFAYYDYVYKSYAYPLLYNNYLGYDYTSGIISYSYLGDYYNGYAAYYCGLSSIGGAF